LVAKEFSSGDEVAVRYYFGWRAWPGVMLSLMRVVPGCLILKQYNGDRLVAVVWCGVEGVPLSSKPNQSPSSISYLLEILWEEMK
jgi:hypothetical protein